MTYRLFSLICFENSLCFSLICFDDYSLIFLSCSVFLFSRSAGFGLGGRERGECGGGGVGATPVSQRARPRGPRLLGVHG